MDKRIKIFFFSRIFLALLVSFFLSVLILGVFKGKKNDIPVLPYSLVLELRQKEDYSLSLLSKKLDLGYAPDYLLDIPNNFYKFTFYKGKKPLFWGKIPKTKIIVRENFGMNNNSLVDYSQNPLGQFLLRLPYFEKTTRLVFEDEKGRVMLEVDLRDLTQPKFDLKRFCGDGICSDNENLFTCFKDCSP